MNTMTTQKDVKDIIEAADLKIIWQHLEKTFGLNVDVYQQHFRIYALTYSRGLSVAECFVEFGTNVIQPVLNDILHRDAAYPTWNNLLRFLLKDKLAESSEQLQYYRSGAWKSMRMDHLDLHIAGINDRYMSI